MTKQELSTKTLKELIELYNEYATFPIKRFPDKKTAVRRVLEVKTAHKSKIKNKKPKKPTKNPLQSRFHGFTNKQIAESKHFKLMCKQFDIEPTIRQASKFRNGRGILHSHMEAS